MEITTDTWNLVWWYFFFSLFFYFFWLLWHFFSLLWQLDGHGWNRHSDGLTQDNSNPSTLATALLQSCTGAHHWSPISLVPHLTGPLSHWSPISLIPHLIGPSISTHPPPSHRSPSHWFPNITVITQFALRDWETSHFIQWIDLLCADRTDPGVWKLTIRH